MATLHIAQQILDIIYPVGSIYLSVNNTNPSNLFGGTWSPIAQGRTLVGVDTSQTEFNTVKKTGGSKSNNHYHTTGDHRLIVDEIPSHTHALNNHTLVNRNIAGKGGAQGSTTVLASTITIGNTGGGKVHNHGNTSNVAVNVLQPYYTCYIWLRTD